MCMCRAQNKYLKMVEHLVAIITYCLFLEEFFYLVKLFWGCIFVAVFTMGLSSFLGGCPIRMAICLIIYIGTFYIAN